MSHTQGPWGSPAWSSKVPLIAPGKVLLTMHRAEFAYDDGRKACIVTVGGSGVVAQLNRRVIGAGSFARARIPEPWMIVVTGPRFDPASFDWPDGVKARDFVPELVLPLAAGDLAQVQGGLTSCIKLGAAGTLTVYFRCAITSSGVSMLRPRLDRCNAGHRMIYGDSTPERIAEAMINELCKPRVFLLFASNRAARAAAMLAR